MIKNIIFDFGNVLVEYNIKEFMVKKGMSPDMIKRLLKASIMGPFWDEFDRGVLTEDEAFEGFLSIDPEIGEELHTVFDNIHGMLTKRDFATDWIKDLKQTGYNVYYLSNYSKKAFEECADSVDFIEYMDGGIMSHQVLMIKPDPNIYKLLLNRYNLKPEECLFVDDTPQNVEVAQTLGMKGIVYTNKEDVDSYISEIAKER
ncbi:MAG: HAD family phosphatase [Lachnospiraceae bacterium]|nr:HAD family phosphatase [Lachnospiraceae bacterium]